MRVFFVLILLLVSAFLMSVAFGAQQLSFSQMQTALLKPGQGPGYIDKIMWDFRLPRACLAVLVGVALAVAGTITQAIMRNPLAEPGILGINSGAALAAVFVIVEADTLSETHLPWLTFCGALTMAITIYLVAWRNGTTSLRIILIGIGIGALAGAGTGFISTFGNPVAVQRAMLWMSGSLQDSRWIKIEILATWLIAPLSLTWLAARELNVISFGDDIARGLGQRSELLRWIMILAIAALSGAAVAAVGLVTFVGLAAPHIAKRLVGRRHQVLLPAAAICGAIMMLAADLAARRMMPPIQLPVGLMTGLVGAPFFGWLLWKRRND